MEKKRSWRIVALWLLTIFSVLYVMPTLIGPQSLPDWYNDTFTKKLNYGLDLQGGLELRYEVDWKKAISDNGRKMGDTVRQRIAEALAEAEDGKNASDMSAEDRKPYEARLTIEIPEYTKIRLHFADQAAMDVLTEDLLATIDNRYEAAGLGGLDVDLILADQQVSDIREQIVNETRSTISKRVEALGLIDPDVRIAGESTVVVQIPGVAKDDMNLVRRQIGKTAQLTLRMVDETSTFFSSQQSALDSYRLAHPERSATLQIAPNAGTGSYARADKKSELVRFVATLDVPDEYIIGYEQVTNTREIDDSEVEESGCVSGGPVAGGWLLALGFFALVRVRRRRSLALLLILLMIGTTVVGCGSKQSGGDIVTEKYWRTQIVTARADINGDHLAKAQVFYDEKGQPYVSLDFNAEGGALFGDLTEANVNKYMAIMLDEEVNSAPVIEEKIGGGRARITLGRGSKPQEQLQEARALVTVLNNGAYKAPVYKVQDHEVGPSLGAASVSAGKWSMAFGMIAVVIFMGLYYAGAGLISIVVLILNVLFILTMLISMNSALTLPGMAGIILTIGMAVDANIIIYERIREEVLAGRSPRAAVDAGYEKALSTILDANITTALAGVILLNYTSGPIRGFAVTLLMGIVSSVFTAVWVSRQLFNWRLNSARPEKLSI